MGMGIGKLGGLQLLSNAADTIGKRVKSMVDASPGMQLLKTGRIDFGRMLRAYTTDGFTSWADLQKKQLNTVADAAMLKTHAPDKFEP